MNRNRAPRLYRVLMLLYPRAFRRRYGPEMGEAFAALHSRARREGRAALAILWARTVGDACASSVRERLRSSGSRAARWEVKQGAGSAPSSGRRHGSGDMGGIAKELAVTVRGLVRRPAYALLALATLVPGVAAMTAGYGLLHEVVLRPLPFEEAGRLVALRTLYGDDPVGLTLPEYLHVDEHATVFESTAALVEPFFDPDWVWTGRSEPEVLSAIRVTAAFFSTLGVEPALGTLPQEGRIGERRVAVSWGFWQQRLGGDPSVPGTVMTVNGEPHVVAAVLPRSFEFPLGSRSVDVWIQYTPEPVALEAELPLAYRGIARLRPGVSVDQASAVVTRLVGDLRSSLAGSQGELSIRPLREDLIGAARRPLVLLTLAGTLVLLVAALNLSLLVAGRNLERQEELRVRAALGASRGRLLRHLVMEVVILAVIGGGIAVALAIAVLERAMEIRPAGLARLAGGAFGAEVVAIGLAAAVVPALLAAGFPALRIAHDVRVASARGSSIDRRGRRAGRALAAVESGVVFALLVVAALVMRSLQEVMAVDPGFDTTATVALELTLPFDAPLARETEAFAAFVTAVEERVTALPGVRGAGTITNLPLSAESWSGSLRIEGRPQPVVGAEVVDWELVSPGYFEAIGIPVIRGRGFVRGDRSDAADVVLINQTLARRWWPDGDPIGARVSGGGPFRTVIGVVGDVKQQGLHAPTRGFMYLPALQFPSGSQHELVVRVDGDDPASAVASIRAALLQIEPALAVGDVRTLGDVVRRSADPFRLRAGLLGVFAAIALLLGMAGIYGVTAHGVHMRRRDIGIRIAVGANGRHVLGNVMGEGLLPVVIGTAGGLGLVLIVAPAVRSLLFGVRAVDPLLLLGIALLLVASAAAAVLPSAMRAQRTDPVAMLRGE
jgi:putative ABC transport system permease protein